MTAAEHHLERLREGRPETPGTTSLHLDVLRDRKRINSQICSVAYPALETVRETLAKSEEAAAASETQAAFVDGRKRLKAMNILLYFASFGSVFAFFAGVIVGTLWVLTKFIQAWGRFFHALIYPPNVPKRRKHLPVGLQQQHLKRAGQ
jgi:hypothetical protein